MTELRKPTRLPVRRRSQRFQADVGGTLVIDPALEQHLQSVINDEVPIPRAIDFVWTVARSKDDVPRVLEDTRVANVQSDPLPVGIGNFLRYNLEVPYRNGTYRLVLIVDENISTVLQEFEVEFIAPPVDTLSVAGGVSLTLDLSSFHYNLLGRQITAAKNLRNAKRFAAEWVFVSRNGVEERTVARLPTFTLRTKPSRTRFRADTTVTDSGAYVLYLVDLDSEENYEIYRVNVRVRLTSNYLTPLVGEKVVLRAATTDSNQHLWLVYRPPSNRSYLAILRAIQDRAAFVESTLPSRPGGGPQAALVTLGQQRWDLIRSGPTLFPHIEDAELSTQLTIAFFAENSTLQPDDEELVALAKFNLLGDGVTAAEIEQVRARPEKLVGRFNPDGFSNARQFLKRLLEFVLDISLFQAQLNDPGRQLILYKMMVSLNRLAPETREFTELSERSAFLVLDSVEYSDIGVYMCFDKSQRGLDSFYDEPNSLSFVQDNERWSLSGIFSLNAIAPTRLIQPADAKKLINLPDVGKMSSLHGSTYVWMSMRNAELSEGIDPNNPPASVEPFAAVESNSGRYARVFIEGDDWDPLPFKIIRADPIAGVWTYTLVKEIFLGFFNFIEAVVDVSFTGYERMAASGSYVRLDATALVPSDAKDFSWSKRGVGPMAARSFDGPVLALGEVRLRHSGIYSLSYSSNNVQLVVNIPFNVRGHCARCNRMVDGINNSHGSCQWHTRHVNAVNAESYLAALETLSISDVRRPLLERNERGEMVARVPQELDDSLHTRARSILIDLRVRNLDEQTALKKLSDLLGVGPVGTIVDRAKRNPFPDYIVEQLFSEGIIDRNPNRYYGLTIFPTAASREEWLCCGEVPAHPGCWIGVHSEDPVPDLNDYMNTESVHGTEHINYPETSAQKHALIATTYDSGNWKEALSLEAKYNRIHGGIATVVVPFFNEGGPAAVDRALHSRASTQLSRANLENIASALRPYNQIGLWKRDDTLAKQYAAAQVFVPLHTRLEYGVFFVHRQQALYHFLLELKESPDQLDALLKRYSTKVQPVPKIQPKIIVLPKKLTPKKQPPPKRSPGKKAPPRKNIPPTKGQQKQPPRPLEDFTTRDDRLNPIPNKPPGFNSLRAIEYDLAGPQSSQLFGRMSKTEQDTVFQDNINSLDDLDSQVDGPLQGWLNYFPNELDQQTLRDLINPLFERVESNSPFIGVLETDNDETFLMFDVVYSSSRNANADFKRFVTSPSIATLIENLKSAYRQFATDQNTLPNDPVDVPFWNYQNKADRANILQETGRNLDGDLRNIDILYIIDLTRDQAFDPELLKKLEGRLVESAILRVLYIADASKPTDVAENDTTFVLQLEKDGRGYSVN